MTTDDTPRPALDAALLERLREQATPDPAPSCWRCGGPMEGTGYSPGRHIFRWYCARDGAIAEGSAGDPDVMVLLAAYESAAAERDALAREAVRLRRAVVLALDGPSDGEIGMETTLGRLNRIERQLRAALAPQEGATDGR